MELNIDELRREGRPLWMTSFGHESVAEFLGGGGDIYSDWLFSPTAMLGEEQAESDA